MRCISPLISAFLSLFISSVCYSASTQPVSIRYPSSLQGVSPVIYKQVESSIEFGNSLLIKNGVNLTRVLGSFQESPLISNSYKDISSAFRDIRGKIESNLITLNDNSYNLFYIDVKDYSKGCGMSTVKSSSNNFSVIAFDPIGLCSSTHIMAHEIGHMDGLRHEGLSGGKICKDGTLSLMMGGVSGGRRFISGAKDCEEESAQSPFAVYKRIEDQRLFYTGPIIEKGVSEVVGHICRVRGLALSVCVSDGAIPESHEELFVVMSGDSESNNYFIIKSGVVDGEGFVTFSLPLSLKNQFYKGERKTKVYIYKYKI